MEPFRSMPMCFERFCHQRLSPAPIPAPVFGGESWLNLNYSYQGFTAGLRYDMYLNSNLRDPNASYTNRGIGRWFVKKPSTNLQQKWATFTTRWAVALFTVPTNKDPLYWQLFAWGQPQIQVQWSVFTSCFRRPAKKCLWYLFRQRQRHRLMVF